MLELVARKVVKRKSQLKLGIYKFCQIGPHKQHNIHRMYFIELFGMVEVSSHVLETKASLSNSFKLVFSSLLYSSAFSAIKKRV